MYHRWEHWGIYDRRTDRRVTVASYPSQELACRQITSWWRRYLRGGRPDITAEDINNYEARHL
jgi:hypothetical protein